MITPTIFSSAVAGAGFWSLAWATLFEVDTLLSGFGVKIRIRDKTLSWAERNKARALITTEFVNFGIHGLTSPVGLAVALGGTVVNSFMLFVGLPVRRRIRKWRGKLS